MPIHPAIRSISFIPIGISSAVPSYFLIAPACAVGQLPNRLRTVYGINGFLYLLAALEGWTTRRRECFRSLPSGRLSGNRFCTIRSDPRSTDLALLDSGGAQTLDSSLCVTGPGRVNQTVSNRPFSIVISGRTAQQSRLLPPGFFYHTEKDTDRFSAHHTEFT